MKTIASHDLHLRGWSSASRMGVVLLVSLVSVHLTMVREPTLSCDETLLKQADKRLWNANTRRLERHMGFFKAF